MQAEQIRFSLMDLFANHQFTEKHRLEEKSLIYLLQLTDRMVNQITYLALPGAEMQDMHQLLKWVDTFRYGEECKAESTLRRLISQYLMELRIYSYLIIHLMKLSRSH